MLICIADCQTHFSEFYRKIHAARSTFVRACERMSKLVLRGGTQGPEHARGDSETLSCRFLRPIRLSMSPPKLFDHGWPKYSEIVIQK